jgi:hypothetical protein
LVEQLIRNQQVSGSNPLVGSRTARKYGRFYLDKTLPASLGGTLGGASIAAITVTDCEARADKGSVREQRLACVGVLG